MSSLREIQVKGDCGNRKHPDYTANGGRVETDRPFTARQWKNW